MTKKIDISVGEIKGTVTQEGDALKLSFEGYGDFDDPNGSPIEIVAHKGKLELLVYGDINVPFPTFTISLDGALESAFVKGD